MGKIAYATFAAPEPDFTNLTTLITLTLADGERLETRADWAIGSARAPMGFDAVREKFDQCAAYAQWPTDRAGAMVRAVAGLGVEDGALAALIASARR